MIFAFLCACGKTRRINTKNALLKEVVSKCIWCGRVLRADAAVTGRPRRKANNPNGRKRKLRIRFLDKKGKTYGGLSLDYAEEHGLLKSGDDSVLDTLLGSGRLE